MKFGSATILFVFAACIVNGISIPDLPLKDGLVTSDITSVHTGFYSQSGDHFSRSKTFRWKQRFFWNDEFFKNDGPVIVLLGGEVPIEKLYLQQGAIIEFCKKLHGIAFEVEHRFFGESWPVDNEDETSLQYLTVGQALADFAEFIQWIKIEYRLKHNKIVIVGASYSGVLALYMKEIYPDLADVVWASSAPFIYVFNLIEYYQFVGQIINNISPNCYNTIKAGFDDMEELLWRGDNKFNPKYLRDNHKDSLASSRLRGGQLVANTFNLCERLDVNNSEDIRNLFQYLASNFADTVQYNSERGNMSMENFCRNLFENENLKLTPMQKLSIFIDSKNSVNGFRCTDFTQKLYCEQLRRTSKNEVLTAGNFDASRTWYWLMCSELGSFQTSDGPNQPFGHSFTVQLRVKQCQCAFGEKFTEAFIRDRVTTHMKQYGGRERTKLTKRIIFVNGENDPWSTPGILHQNQTSRKNRVVLIKGASHCFDLGPTNPKTDSAAVILARQIIHSQIESWLRNA